MEVTWGAPAVAEAVEDEGSTLGPFPPYIRLRSLVQLVPFWPFFMVAGREGNRRPVSFFNLTSMNKLKNRSGYFDLFLLFICIFQFNFDPFLRKTQKKKPQTGTETNFRNKSYFSPPSGQHFKTRLKKFWVLQHPFRLQTADCVYKTIYLSGERRSAKWEKQKRNTTSHQGGAPDVSCRLTTPSFNSSSSSSSGLSSSS